MYPLGFLSLKAFLAANGLKAEIVNIASLMLMHPKLDVLQIEEARVKARIDTVRQRYGSNNAFQQALRQQGVVQEGQRLLHRRGEEFL